MTEEIVSPQTEQENVEELTQEMQQDAEEISEEISEENQEAAEPEKKEEMVPLSALQKERRKRQEKESQLEYERQLRAQYQPAPPEEEDLSEYESLTKKDISKIQQDTVRMVEERNWTRDNREKAEFVNENLQEFLNQRPHLASAIKDAPNRYEEAWLLMNALSPRQQQQLRKPAPERKPAPGNPKSVPKAAAMNEAVDLMSMSDSEYLAWRKAQKKR